MAAFTDGSRSDTSQSAACGVYIPRIQFKGSWKLNKLTSSYTAELMGIRQALHILYYHHQEEITIYSESQAAIQTICDYKFDSNPAIPEIIETIMNHHAAGTKINLAWIPSHCGIHGNEEADRLAAEGCTSPSRGHIDNTISIQEIIAAFNLVWRSKVINNSVGQSSNIAVTSRFRSFGPLAWHLHDNRQIQTALFKLRSGHNRLNHSRGRWNTEISQLCPNGCENTEDAEHVLLHCNKYQNERRRLLDLFTSLKIPISKLSLLGLNLEIPKHTQQKIQKHLNSFLKSTDLLNRI